MSRAVGDGGRARRDGLDSGAVDGRGGQGVDRGVDLGAAGRAVGHGGGARGDGVVLGRVDRALDALGHDGTGEDSDSSETHFDGCFGLVGG